METNYYLYKIIDVDKLVYIGKSSNIDFRISTHNVICENFEKDDYFLCRGELIQNPLVYVANIENEYWLSLYEITLISKYMPLYNKGDVYETNTFLHIPKLNWFPYVSKEDALHSYCMRTGKLPNKNMLETPLKRWKLLNTISEGDGEYDRNNSIHTCKSSN